MRLLLVAGVLLLTAGPASADPAVPVDLCTVSDQRLEELSGFASEGERWFAVNDSDNGGIAVQVLGRDCAVLDTITAPANPFDVEDLALAPDGRLWLADTGDNGRSRETVALHVVSPDGSADLFRLTYPDGAHDAEAILLDRQGTPYIVTKEPIGSALVYRPTGPLNADAPTPMEQVASVWISGTDTPGGPVQSAVVTRLVTGGAVSHDGKVVALRTYTDAYLFPVPNDDLVAAFKSQPVRVPLPDEAQGEAIAFDPDGTLLSASEFGKTGTSSAVRAVAGAAALAVPAPPSTTSVPPPAPGDNVAAAQDTPSDRPVWPVIGFGVVAFVLIAAFVRRARRRA